MNSIIFALSSSSNVEMTVGEKLIYGGQMLLLGIGAVFSVLLIIYLCLLIFKAVFSKSSKKEKKVEVAPVVATPIQTVNTSQNEEIVAVIAAAIAMAEAEGSGVKFRVVSFRRV